MAKVVQTTLQISETNVEQYCIADGLSLNTGGYAIRLYLNGHTQGSAILNDAAKEVLYPSATAHPFKIDSFIRANKSGGSMTISLQFNGTSVQSESGDWGTGLKNKTKEGISDSVVINSNRSTEIKWHIKGSSTVSRFSIASTNLTFYFNQYEMRPLVGNNVNGIQKVTVSNASPCQGDTVTFTPKLVNGAAWVGWYSDAACTNLVSTDQNYSVSPSSDITLYAKATIDAVVYSCSAVAGENISSASVSDESVVSGENATFTATLSDHCTFDGWFSDSNYATLVSTANPYTATITSDTILYAKGTKISYSVRVGTAEHGIATVSTNTAYYGDSVTFTFAPEDDTWELYGWYSDEGLTQLMSENNPYTYSVTDNVILYPKVGRIKYKITFKTIAPANYIDIKAAVLDFDALTRTEKSYLKVGNYEAIEQSKVFDIKSASISSPIIGKILTVEILCPLGMTVAFWGTDTRTDSVYICYIDDANNNALTSWPYYWYQPSEEATFKLDEGGEPCNCFAIAKEGISYVDVTTPTRQGYNAVFEAGVASGYIFSGWYSDEACTTLVSTDNPAYVITPTYTTESKSATSLTLYAKAIDPTVIYTVQVGSQPEDGNANVNASTATYGDVVTFTANIAGANREFYGWYSDSSYTNLVSTSAIYNHTVTGDTTLYPKSGKKRYTAILHPTYASDVRPYRGSSRDGVKAASPSVPQNVNVLANNTVNSSTYAYQLYRASTYHNYGIAFWINNVEQLSSAPDNATIVDLYAQIAISFSDTSYGSAIVYSGTYTYLCEGDETPAIQKGTNVNIPISTNKTIVTINKSQMGNWTIKELKDGNLGFQINTAVNSGDSNTRQQRFYGIDVYVVYTIEDTSYRCEAISDGHVDVSVSSHDVVPGGSCTWTAVQEGGYRFDGWYSDSNFENLVSTSAIYTTTINSNKTLYAKTHYHSRIIARELDIPYGQGRTYFIGKDINGNILDPDTSGSGWKPDFDMSSYGWLAELVGVTDVKATAASCNGAEYVSAVINSAGMSILYPNDTAHPVKMDSHALLGRAAITSTALTSTLTNPITEDDTITPMVDGIQSRIWRPKNINNIPYNFTNLRLPSILNSTRNSTIEYRMHQYVRTKYRAIGIDDIRLTLYFEEYDFSAQIANNAQGIDAVACSQAIGYEGDSVTYTVTLSPGVIWNGWYADPNCKTLVSTEQTYTTVPNSNLTLYAKASTELTTGTGLYIKRNGTFIEANAVYKKINGAWEQQDDPKSLFLGSPSGSESNYIYCGEL